MVDKRISCVMTSIYLRKKKRTVRMLFYFLLLFLAFFFFFLCLICLLSHFLLPFYFFAMENQQIKEVGVAAGYGRDNISKKKQKQKIRRKYRVGMPRAGQRKFDSVFVSVRG
eukprot:TRINITY_DN267_c4_g1_i1.p1 TRINITY_DN267_c4_g1~~TRINITY_DN267_c4_g1_i1.p1  ORF type:complete len:112 (-),score=0.29 TRINITY_DN267_c4_g1_i1:113-448(-)